MVPPIPPSDVEILQKLFVQQQTPQGADYTFCVNNRMVLDLLFKMYEFTSFQNALKVYEILPSSSTTSLLLWQAFRVHAVTMAYNYPARSQSMLLPNEKLPKFEGKLPKFFGQSDVPKLPTTSTRNKVHPESSSSSENTDNRSHASTNTLLHDYLNDSFEKQTPRTIYKNVTKIVEDLSRPHTPRSSYEELDNTLRAALRYQVAMQECSYPELFKKKGLCGKKPPCSYEAWQELRTTLTKQIEEVVLNQSAAGIKRMLVNIAYERLKPPVGVELSFTDIVGVLIEEFPFTEESVRLFATGFPDMEERRFLFTAFVAKYEHLIFDIPQPPPPYTYEDPYLVYPEKKFDSLDSKHNDLAKESRLPECQDGYYHKHFRVENYFRDDTFYPTQYEAFLYQNPKCKPISHKQFLKTLRAIVRYGGSLRDPIVPSKNFEEESKKFPTFNASEFEAPPRKEGENRVDPCVEIGPLTNAIGGEFYVDAGIAEMKLRKKYHALCENIDNDPSLSPEQICKKKEEARSVYLEESAAIRERTLRILGGRYNCYAPGVWPAAIDRDYFERVFGWTDGALNELKSMVNINNSGEVKSIQADPINEGHYVPLLRNFYGSAMRIEAAAVEVEKLQEHSYPTKEFYDNLWPNLDAVYVALGVMLDHDYAMIDRGYKVMIRSKDPTSKTGWIYRAHNFDWPFTISLMEELYASVTTFLTAVDTLLTKKHPKPLSGKTLNHNELMARKRLFEHVHKLAATVRLFAQSTTIAKLEDVKNLAIHYVLRARQTFTEKNRALMLAIADKLGVANLSQVAFHHHLPFVWGILDRTYDLLPLEKEKKT